MSQEHLIEENDKILLKLKVLKQLLEKHDLIHRNMVTISLLVLYSIASPLLIHRPLLVHR